MTTPRILIVDDDPALLQALPEALHLRMGPVRVDTAESATPALERIAGTEYDAIVCDIKLPGMDGLALLAEIRKLRPGVPTLLITGHGQHDLAVQALRGGAFDFIQKPIEREYLIASLRRAIHVHDLSRQVEEQKRALERHAAHLEDTVNERTRELRESNRAKDEFLATLAHELRNPLAPIRNAVELMQHCNLGDPTLRRARDIIERQVGHMTRLIDDLLDVSRIQRGKIKLQKRPLDLAMAVANSVESCTPFINARHHELTVSLAPEPLVVLADATRLEQIVTNLLHNAAKYTEPRGRITLSAARDGDEIVLRVRDTGIGIAPEMLPRIFDLCFQADDSLERTHGGLGVGLTLVRYLAQLHGGSVQAFSAGLGQGSEFVVRLPHSLLGARPPAINNVGLFPVAPGRARRVLIIEDNADSRESLCDLLRLWGYQVEVAGDGMQGLKKALNARPEIALIDIGLPGMNGYEVAQQVRTAIGPEDIFLVALTGYGQPDDRRKALEAGFNTHLVKPVNLDELCRLLGTVPAHA